MVRARLYSARCALFFELIKSLILSHFMIPHHEVFFLLRMQSSLRRARFAWLLRPESCLTGTGKSWSRYHREQRDTSTAFHPRKVHLTVTNFTMIRLSSHSYDGGSARELAAGICRPGEQRAPPPCNSKFARSTPLRTGTHRCWSST